MEKRDVLKHLREFIAAAPKKNENRKHAKLRSALEGITEDAISFGAPPKYFFAYLECNSTGVGTSSFQGSETQRTVARDYTTDEYLFVDGHIGACKKGLSLFHLKKGETINYCHKNEIEKVAKSFGYQLHSQYFSDLNFTLIDHRLNRHKVNVTKGPFTSPIRPIFATISSKGDKITIGYVYEKNGQEYIIIEPEEPKRAKSDSGCAPWMFLGFIFPPIFIAAIFVLLVKAKKERMIG